MATTAAKAGLVESTITTGTGAYALLGGVTPPWRGFVAGDDAKVFGIGVYQDGVGFEEGEYTYNHGTRTLARTTIRHNHLNTTAPIDWGAGTKEISNVIGSSTAMQTTVENKVAADQFMRGWKLFLDPGDASYLSAATNNIVRFFLNFIETLKLEAGKLTLSWTDDSATEGPELKLDRNNGPGAASDALGVLRMTGRDSSSNEHTAFKLRSMLTSATAGAPSSKASFDIIKTGNLQTIFEMRTDTLTVMAGCDLYTGGKGSSSLTTVGAEMTRDGELVAVVQDAACGFFSRKGSDGLVIDVSKDGASQGGVQCLAGTVSIAGSSMTHQSDWAPDVQGDGFESLGWVVCTADGLLEDDAKRHPLARPARTAGDPCVYGVVAGRYDGKLWIEAKGAGLIRCVGPINRGDLLESSATEGCAQAQAGTAILSSTVAKATQSSPDTGVRLVPCTLLAG